MHPAVPNSVNCQQKKEHINNQSNQSDNTKKIPNMNQLKNKEQPEANLIRSLAKPIICLVLEIRVIQRVAKHKNRALNKTGYEQRCKSIKHGEK